MRKPEQLLWDAMRRNLPSALWLQRVENVVGDGMPDVYVGRSGKWVELKVPQRVPARASTPLLGQHGLRLSQINWHIKHATMNHSQRSYILVRLPGTLELVLLPGSAAGSINEGTLTFLRSISYPVKSWTDLAQELKDCN